MVCDPNKQITQAQIDRFRENIEAENQHVNSNEETFQKPGGGTGITQQGIENAATRQRDSIQQRAETLLSGIGFTVIGLYTADLTITERNQSVQFGTGTSATYWAPIPSVALPYTIDSTTNPNPGDDNNLRQVGEASTSYVQNEANTGDSLNLGGAVWPLSSQTSAAVGDDITNFPFLTFNSTRYKVVPELAGDILTINEDEVDADDSGLPPSAMRPVAHLPRVNEQKFEALRNVISSYSGDGFNFVTLGDSTEAGVGGTGGIYAQTTNDLRNGFTNRVGFSLVKADPNFVGVDPQNKNYRSIVTSPFEVAYEGISMLVSQDPNYETLVYSQSRNSRTDLTVYFHQRTNDAAARGLVSVYNTSGTLITSQRLDSYTPDITFGSAGSFPVAGRLQKLTIPLGTSTRGVRVVIDDLDVIDRGSGVPSDGTLFIYGFTLGQGVGLHNLAVSSTTLTEGSADNILRGVDTSERVALAQTLDADVVYIGWGTNDSKTGVTTLSQFKDDYRALIDNFRAWKSSIQIIMGTDPRGLGSPHANNPIYNNAIRDVAVEKDCILFDIETMFDVAPSDFYADTVHPSAKGYQALHYAMCNFLGVVPFEEAESRYIENRTITRSHAFTIPVTSDFTGSFVEVLDQTVEVPNWARGFIILCDVNVARAGSDLSLCAAQLLVNGFIVDRKVISVPQVSGTAVGQLSLNYNQDPSSLPQDLRVQVNLRDYGIRATDSTSGVRIRFV